MKSIIEHARLVIERAKYENDNLNVVIAALVGALMSKTKEDALDIEKEEIFVDSNTHNTNEAHIRTIQYDDDGTLAYTDDDSEEPSDLKDLPFDTRLELADKLAQMLED